METGDKVAIVGAGAVGTSFAYALQISGAAQEIVLIDLDRERAEGEALDLSHGLFFTPPVRIEAGGYEECEGADVVVMTAGASQEPDQSRMELVETNVKICRSVVEEVLKHTEDAVLLMVTNPVDVLTYAALKFSGLPRHQVIGAGTVLDSARFRYLLGQHCNIDTRNIHGYVLGEHGDTEVMAWSLTHVGGVPMEEFCELCPHRSPTCDLENIGERVRDSAYHLIDAKGATNWAVGLAMVKIVTSVLRDENSLLTVSTLMDGEYGLEGQCMSLPTIVNASGAEDPIAPRLGEEETEAMRRSGRAIREVIEQVGLD